VNSQVTTALRSTLRPGLRAAGFTEFAGRTAWASVESAVWCVSTPSFGSHIAHGVGCTTASFGVDIGVFFGPPGGGSTSRPSEAECTFRFTCHKTLVQPLFHPYGRTPATDRSDVWYVAEDGSNLSSVIDDACHVILGPGIAQLAACAALDDALARLHAPGTTVSPLVTEFDVAPQGSPRWHERVALLESLR
jgi:hypothetical protein